MKQGSASEILLVEEVTQVARGIIAAARGLPIGMLVKIIRTQLGMPQKILAKRSGAPQSTISRLEKGRLSVSIPTLEKICAALSCDLVIAPSLQDSIETIRRKQAKKVAAARIRYLKGTMNLEEQQPDSRFLEELLKQEENRLLAGPNYKLWEE
ncbi:MAG: helix-turn-helix domain-containing protein [Chlamydiales bacterium]|nr:helix-turn-helix domain-containing protein [Chlamydiales bacterium]